MDGHTSETDRVRPTNLRTRYRSAPNNVPLEAPPGFSWTVNDPTWGTQAAYRVRLARSRNGLADGRTLWDSGVVASSRSIDVAYEGPLLAPDETYRWTATVWNNEGKKSAVGGPATFSTAPADGPSGEWIGRQPGAGDSNGYRSCWRRPEENPIEWIQVDLGTDREFETVELHPTEPFTGITTPDSRTITASDTEDEYLDATVAQGPVAFGFPDGYRVEASNEPTFENARAIVDATDAGPPESRSSPAIHEVESVNARYVRVVATDLDEFDAESDRLREEFRSWAVFALAALAVRDDEGTDLARGRPVEASSSVESESWGCTYLTDSEYRSTMTGTAPLFRTEFELAKPVVRARAHFAGLGYGELYVNGKKVGDAALDPSWTQYDERICYVTYDLGDELKTGTNAIGIWLGRGWFGRSARHWTAFGSPRALCQVTVEYEDGTTCELSTGGDWQTASSPVVENDIYDGERYDARLKQSGWTESGFDDAAWESAAVVDSPEGDLFPQQIEPIVATETIEPVEIREHEDGPIIDFGQNHAGRLSIDIEGGEPGNEVILHHAEALDKDGELQTVDLRSADATDIYVIADGDADTYEPRFTYHGYRYAQITGYPGELLAEDVRSRVVHTAMDSTGEFACSNEELTAVQENAQWGLRSNAHSVPTDCPQRDERMGFSGDGHIAARALHYNFDAVRFHEKWLRDHVDTQSRHGYVPAKCPFGAIPSMTDPSWTVSILAIPWHLYRSYGDEGILKRNYESLRRYVDFWDSVAEGNLLPEEYGGYGDWVALENADGRRGEPTDLFTNAFYYRSVDLLARIASAIGCDGDAVYYRERADAIADAFDGRYFDAERTIYKSGTQASYALPLFFGLTPPERANEVAANLAEKVAREDDGQLRTGFLGTRPLLFALSEYGYADLAYHVISQPESPGWVYMLHQGATTMWERWDSDEHIGGRMNSLNHSPFALVSEWFFDSLAGIDVDLGSSERYPVEIAPSFVDDLSWVEGTTETPRGEVHSRWESINSGYEMTIDLPWNAPARVALPIDSDVATIGIDGRPIWTDATPVANLPDAVKEVSATDRRVVVGLVPGSYRLRIE